LSNETLTRYPLALNAAPQIRDAVTGDEPTSSLEDYLREELAESKDTYDRRRLLSIQLYLQDLLLGFGHSAHRADNYRRLLNPLLDAHDHVCFITLNYDVLLDACLRPLDPLDDIGDFIGHERWSLIKPHGSATWGRDVYESWLDAPDEVFVSPPENLLDALDSTITHRWSVNIHDVRSTDKHGVVGRFPAVSAPLGEDDELVCPPEHLDFLRSRLEGADNYDLLVIGYSGLDKSVLDLLTATSASPRSVYVVDAEYQSATASATRLASRFGDSIRPITKYRVADGTSTEDIAGKGSIAWHADKRSFGQWVTVGPAEYADFLAHPPNA
jgi:hypothetical protein